MTHICVRKLTIICSDDGLSPSHYLNRCWNIVNWTLRNKLQCYFNRNSNIFIEEYMFENVVCEMLSISSCVLLGLLSMMIPCLQLNTFHYVTADKVAAQQNATKLWASYQILEITVCAYTGNARNVFPATDCKGNHQLAIPACITARACMSRSLTRGGVENIPGISGTCATHNFAN